MGEGGREVRCCVAVCFSVCAISQIPFEFGNLRSWGMEYVFRAVDSSGHGVSC